MYFGMHDEANLHFQNSDSLDAKDAFTPKTQKKKRIDTMSKVRKTLIIRIYEMVGLSPNYCKQSGIFLQGMI